MEPIWKYNANVLKMLCIDGHSSTSRTLCQHIPLYLESRNNRSRLLNACRRIDTPVLFLSSQTMHRQPNWAIGLGVSKDSIR